MATPARSTDTLAAILSQIADERRRQIEVEGYDAAHDDAHSTGEIALAAAAYAEIATSATPYRDGKWAPTEDGKVYLVGAPLSWPWSQEAFRPKTPRHDLIRAAALIVAEIERLDRAAEKREAE